MGDLTASARKQAAKWPGKSGDKSFVNDIRSEGIASIPRIISKYSTGSGTFNNFFRSHARGHMQNAARDLAGHKAASHAQDPSGLEAHDLRLKKKLREKDLDKLKKDLKKAKADLRVARLHDANYPSDKSKEKIDKIKIEIDEILDAMERTSTRVKAIDKEEKGTRHGKSPAKSASTFAKSLDEPVAGDEGDKMSLMDIIPAEDDSSPEQLERGKAKAIVMKAQREALKELDVKDPVTAYLIRSRFGLGLPEKSVPELMKFTYDPTKGKEDREGFKQSSIENEAEAIAYNIKTIEYLVKLLKHIGAESADEVADEVAKELHDREKSLKGFNIDKDPKDWNPPSLTLKARNSEDILLQHIAKKREHLLNRVKRIKNLAATSAEKALAGASEGTEGKPLWGTTKVQVNNAIQKGLQKLNDIIAKNQKQAHGVMTFKQFPIAGQKERSKTGMKDKKEDPKKEPKEKPEKDETEDEDEFKIQPKKSGLKGSGKGAALLAKYKKK